MPTLAETLLANPKAAAPDVGAGMTEAVASGIKLAQAKDAIEIQKAQMQAARDEINMKKVNTYFDDYNYALSAPSEKLMRARFQRLNMRAKAMGQASIPDEAIDTIITDKDFQNQLTTTIGALQTSGYDAQGAQRIAAYIGQISQDAKSYEDGVKTFIENKRKQETSQAMLAETQLRRTGLEEERNVRRTRAANEEIDKVGNKFLQEITNLRTRLDAAKSIKAQVNLATPQSDEMLKPALNKLAGDVGNMSDTERKAVGISRDLANQIQSTFSKYTTGQILTPKDREAINKIADTFQSQIQEALKTRADSFIKAKSVAYPELKDRIKESIYQSAGIENKTKDITTALQEAVKAKMSLSSVKAFIKNKYNRDLTPEEEAMFTPTMSKQAGTAGEF